MTITKKNENGRLNVALEGRLDTTTAPQLEESLKDDFESISGIDFDFTKLEYISSAGLRVLLAARKKLGSADALCIYNATEEVKEIFDITGFSDIISVK